MCEYLRRSYYACVHMLRWTNRAYIHTCITMLHQTIIYAYNLHTNGARDDRTVYAVTRNICAMSKSRIAQEPDIGDSEDIGNEMMDCACKHCYPDP